MIDDFFLGIAPHLLVIVFVLVEDPLEVWYSFSKLDLFPDLAIDHNGPN